MTIGAQKAFGAPGAFGALCAFGALGAFGAENVQWCTSLYIFIRNARASIRGNGSKPPDKDDFLETMAFFDTPGLVNNEQKQALIKLGALGAHWGRFGALSVRFGALLRNDDQLLEKIRDYVSEASGGFSNSQVYQDLAIASAEEKKRIRAELSRLVKKNVIEKGDKNGSYRKIDDKVEKMDFVNASDETVPIFWPLGIHNLVKIMPGNVICVAGETNAGKTAFLLNLVNENQTDFDIHYFSSEMGPAEMKGRLKYFDRPITDWHFSAYERSHDFHDVIRPGKNKINIIDYIEISDEFWKISGIIRAIYDKLDGAIAVIALQKNKGTEYGVGGMKSAEKARLYISMSPHIARIAKAKAFKNPSVNPNGMELEYRLRSGCHFTVDRDWHRKEKNKKNT